MDTSSNPGAFHEERQFLPLTPEEIQRLKEAQTARAEPAVLIVKPKPALREIHRMALEVGRAVVGPSGPVTFNYQSSLKEFSIWFQSDSDTSEIYLVVPTGHQFPGDYSLVATTIVDGYYTFHLLRFAGSPEEKTAMLMRVGADTEVK